MQAVLTKYFVNVNENFRQVSVNEFEIETACVYRFNVTAIG